MFCCPSLSSLPFDWTLRCEYVSVVLFCYILDVVLCVKKNVDNKKKRFFYFNRGTQSFSSLSPPKLIYSPV